MKSEYGDIGPAIVRLVGYAAVALLLVIGGVLVFVWLLAQVAR